MFFMISVVLSCVLLMIFFLLGKSFSWETHSTLSFECGFTSYFFSRFSFSMHYYLLGIIFLFLDLELCFLMPFFNEDFSESKFTLLSWLFVLVLLAGLGGEWLSGKLEWKF